jgi:hypothetical protein
MSMDGKVSDRDLDDRSADAYITLEWCFTFFPCRSMSNLVVSRTDERMLSVHAANDNVDEKAARFVAFLR